MNSGRRSDILIVAATTASFPNLSLSDALQRIADLEYTAVEIAITDDSNHITPAAVSFTHLTQPTKA